MSVELALFSTVSQREVSTPQHQIFADAAEQVRLAEQIGFGTAWFPEHHFTNYSICPNPIMLAGHVAASTSRIRVGPAVVVVPLHHPIRVLEELALLDQLSGGRLAVGLGGGYQEHEFAKFGRDIRKNQTYIIEFLDILDQFLRAGSIELDGELGTIPPTRFTLRTQQANPPIFLASGTSAAPIAQRIAARGYCPIVSMVGNSTATMIDKHKAIEAAYREAGGEADTMPFALNQYMYVTRDLAEARRAAEAVRYVLRMHAAMRRPEASLDGSLLKEMPFDGEPSADELIERLAIGEPSKVADHLNHQLDAMRASQLSFIMGLPGLSSADTLRSMHSFGQDVLPKLQGWAA
jgi:alkanesulfonate monooxygenase SsuD/methylene tetrahydromethanopterin reductase-like flavin-dependent oxidoreductase (luciferase family)